jgi:phosphatidylinositol-3-phosphatase
VVTPSDDDQRGPGRRSSTCVDCGTTLSGDHRYCVECGARRGPLPSAIATRVAAMLEWARAAAAPFSEAPPPGEDGEEQEGGGFMPTPRAAAVAVMGMLAFGVMVGSAISPLARSAGLSSILLEVPAPPPSEAEEAPVTAEAPEAEASEPIVAETSTAPLVPEEEAFTEEPVEEPTELPEIPEEETLPPVKHVFLIVLGENGYEEAYGASSPAPYLAKTLTAQGELLSNYYAVTRGDLANQIALLSGQGPTAETAANCPNYADVSPGTLSATGQVEGSGCVYPAEAQTLPGQLVEEKLKWKAYVEDIGNGAGEPTSCRHPALGAPDPRHAPTAGDAYETWRNPFVYFHSLIDTPECAERDVGLDQLAPDLQAAKTTPTLAYIVPNACHDGGEAPCEEGRPSGPVEAESFLQTVVPEIEASPAYREGGLIAIVSSQARQTGPTPDTSSCCIGPAYPNLPEAPPAEAASGPVKPSGGGGRVGLLLISPFVAPGTVNESGYYNDFSLLRSIEELFELEPLGYASEPALTAFDSTVYTGEAAPVAEEPLPTPKRSQRRSIQALARALTP